ncbi:MAG TPA: carboxymuconolactone decarboxylase family protein [Gaiellaceae bacterium]|nr:carboxymuconolactone decarboxylase family protein [Gaiellaceae bacterium]
MSDARVVARQRMDTRRSAPELHRALIELDAAVAFDPPLRELVRLRASILNGCAYCIQLHTQEALKAGEESHRLFAVAAWEESPFFDARERAALRFTDAVTLLHEDHVPDEVWAEVAEQFEEQELAELLFAIVVINAFNRLAIATRKEPQAPRS